MCLRAAIGVRIRFSVCISTNSIHISFSANGFFLFIHNDNCDQSTSAKWYQYWIYLNTIIMNLWTVFFLLLFFFPFQLLVYILNYSISTHLLQNKCLKYVDYSFKWAEYDWLSLSLCHAYVSGGFDIYFWMYNIWLHFWFESIKTIPTSESSWRKKTKQNCNYSWIMGHKMTT